MNFPEYINSTGLGAPVAGFYFTVEQGTSTVSWVACTPRSLHCIALKPNNPPLQR